MLSRVSLWFPGLRAPGEPWAGWLAVGAQPVASPPVPAAEEVNPGAGLGPERLSASVDFIDHAVKHGQ